MTKQDWTKWKGIITGGLGALTARLGTLAYPMAVLAALNLVDYATGYKSAAPRWGYGVLPKRCACGCWWVWGR